MPAIPLLPQGTWRPQAAVGLHSLSDQEYQQNLCENYYDASDFGTPSPFAHALVFRDRLERFQLDLQSGDGASRFEDSFALWQLLLQGIYLGCIELRDVQLSELGELGRIVRGELPESFPFRLLWFGDEVVGFSFPQVGFVPSVRLSRETADMLRQEVRERTVESAADYFVAWVRSHDEKELGDVRFYALLYEVARRWNPDGPSELPKAPEKLFGQTAPLWLSGDGAADLARPWLPVYVGTPILCPQETCYYDNFTSGHLEISNPADLSCPTCEIRQDWLHDYAQWIRYSEEKGCYLIYAFDDSGIHGEAYRKRIRYEEDGVVVTTRRMTIKVKGLVLTEEALKCTRLTFFRDRDQIIRPSLPVRGEYYGLVELSPTRRPVVDAATQDYLVFLQVAGWDDEIMLRYARHEIQEEEALFLTWPNFRLEGWNAYFYLLETSPRLQKAGICLRGLDPQATPVLLEASRGRLERAFDAFEVVFAQHEGVKRGAVTAQAGIFTVPHFTIQRGRSAVTLALDFGTSNTSAWYRLGNGEPRLVRFKDFTECIVSNQVLSDRVLTYSQWLPTFRLDDPQTAERFYCAQLEAPEEELVDAERIIERLDYFIPSELIIDHPVSAQQLDRPLSGFRICHAFASQPDGKVIFGLKATSEDGDAEGRYSYEQAVSRYLELFLTLVLAAVVSSEERAGFLKLRATFPRAFSPEKVGLYLASLDRTLTTLERQTGFTTNSKLYVDEARAAAYSARMPEGLALVMDMGGGTTDIGVFEWQGGELSPIFTESLEYGGNAFLRLLAGEHDADLFPKPTVSRLGDARMLWLLREIRLRGFETVVHSQYRGNVSSRSTMLDLLLRFYSPLAFFVGRLFEALPVLRQEDRDYRREPVSYYLVGNGWTLADAMSPLDSGYGQGHHEVLRYLLRRQGFTDLTPAKEPAFDPRRLRWPGPKAAVGYGAIVAPERLFYRDVAAAAGDVDGTRSVAGFDYYYTDGSSGRHPVEWHHPVPHPVASSRQLPVLSDLDLPDDWSFLDYDDSGVALALQEVCARDILREDHPVMTRSILTRFLEKVYVTQLSRARRT